MTGSDQAAHRIRRVLALLEQERGILLSGRFDRLDGLTRSLEAALTALEAAGDVAGHEGLLRQLDAMAQRNLALAAGSRRGIRAAGRIVGQGMDGARLRTYSPDGGTQRLGHPPHRRDRRT